MRNYVVVVGAGLSLPIVTSVSGITEKLQDRSGIVCDESEHLWDYCERVYDHLRNRRPNCEDDYYDVVRECFEVAPPWSADAYRYLVEIGFRSFVTFNYDRQLPLAFLDKYPGDFPDRFRIYRPALGNHIFPPGLLFSGEQRLVAVHGCADTKTNGWERHLVLRRSDYDLHYTGSSPILFEWWQTLLISTPCIFIGTKLHEPGIEQVLKHSPPDYLEAIKKLNHLHLLDQYGNGDPPVWSKPGISLSFAKQVFYDPIDPKYHYGLIDILKALSGKPRDLPSPRSSSIPALSATDNHNFPNVT